jgi:ABC-2 type transport system permease protein
MTFRLFRLTLATSARQVLADRSTLLASVGFYAVVVSVLTALWRAAAQANGGAVVGYDARALTWYIVASEAATVALNLRLIETTGDAIASGAVASELLRPASVVWIRVTTEVGRALPRLASCSAVGTAIALVAVGRPPRASALALAVPSVVLAISCNLVGQHAFAAASFWVRDARSTWFLYQKFVFIVGGMLLPLEVLPGPLHTAALWLPFEAMAYAPARLASGHFEPHLLAMQLAWFLALGALAHACFRAGERRLQVVGG